MKFYTGKERDIIGLHVYQNVRDVKFEHLNTLIVLSI